MTEKSKTIPKRSRRRFLKTAGIGSLGVLTTLAGCAGGDGGGGRTTSDELQDVHINLAPSGFQGVMMDHINEDTDILKNELADRGFSPTVQKSWEGAALFAAGGPDFETLSTLEATRLGSEREIEIVTIGEIAPLVTSWYVVKGSEWDPNTGGTQQEIIDKIVEEQRNVAIASWSDGAAPGFDIVLDEQFGYTFAPQEETDFNIYTADYFAIPELLLNGEVVAGNTAPLWGTSKYLDDNGEPMHTSLFHSGKVIDQELDLGIPNLNNLVTDKEFYDQNPGAAEGYLQAWHRGIDWLMEDPMGRIMEDPENHFTQIGVESEQQAQFLVDWALNLEYDNPYPVVYENQEYNEEKIQKDKEFLDRAQTSGFVPEEWRDWLTYEMVPQE